MFGHALMEIFNQRLKEIKRAFLRNMLKSIVLKVDQ